jgi:pyridoxine 5-phosphate synthase
MIRLSVNVNKIATIRNSRGGTEPRVLDAVAAAVDAGAHGITVHPRADRRHVTPDDVRAIAKALEPVRSRVELNIEGDPRPEILALVREVHPDQCTLVPVTPGEVTSHAGWTEANATGLAAAVDELRSQRVRVSLFVDADPAAVRFAAGAGADRVELYTEPFARAFEQGATAARESFGHYAAAARAASAAGLGVNAGHDLDLANLVMFRELPHLAEVSIGHAIISRAVFVGLAAVVREYLDVLSAVL